MSATKSMAEEMLASRDVRRDGSRVAVHEHLSPQPALAAS